MEVTSRPNPQDVMPRPGTQDVMPRPGTQPNSNGGETIKSRFSTSAHGAVDRAAEGAAHSVKPAIETVVQVAHQAIDQVADLAGPTADWLRRQGRTLDDAQKRISADAGRVVATHPWKCMGAAVIAGLFLSRLMR
ncbi:MAG: hypothetical protein ACKVQQ_11850 [Burkholderiales bacterium]